MSVNVCLIDSSYHSGDLTPHVCGSPIGSFHKKRLEPAVEPFDRTVVAGHAFWDEEHFNIETKAQANHSAKIVGGFAPTAEFSPVVELDDIWDAKMLPSAHEKGQNGVC